MKSKILAALSAFSPDELRIVQEDFDFDNEKRHLWAVMAKINNGTAQYFIFEELDAELDSVISRYEN